MTPRGGPGTGGRAAGRKETSGWGQARRLQEALSEMRLEGTTGDGLSPVVHSGQPSLALPSCWPQQKMLFCSCSWIVYLSPH